MGTLRNLLRAESWWDWDLCRRLCEKKYGGPDEGWLPELVATKGFEPLAAELKEAFQEYRRRNPPQRNRLELIRKPTWFSDAGTLSLGEMTRTFRRQRINPVLRVILDEFEKAGWPPSVKLDKLDPDKVRDAAKSLRKKTKARIYWKASDDCVVTWHLLGT